MTVENLEISVLVQEVKQSSRATDFPLSQNLG